MKENGHDVKLSTNLDAGQLKKKVKDAEALIVRSGTQVTAELLKAAANLKVVGRAGVGVDNVDLDTATELGIMVVNAPESNLLSAAEHTMGLILAQARNIPQAHKDLTDGKWERAGYKGVELNGKVLGIVGLGRIGRLVASRAAAFGMKIAGFDPYVSKNRAEQMGVDLYELKELMAVSDFLTLHTSATSETKNLINADILSAAKPGLRLINVSRGEIVDEKALYDALDSGHLGGAALDVFADEPPKDSPLLNLSQVVVTPHLGASTVEAQDRVGVAVAEQVAVALAGEFPKFAVNIAVNTAPESFRPFLPLCEQLGSFLAGLIEGQFPSILDLEFQGEIATTDTGAGLLAVLAGLFRATSDQPVSYVNALSVAEARGLKVRSVSNPATDQYVNQIMLRAGEHQVGGTVIGLKGMPKIIWVDGHSMDLPPAEHMILIKNDDRPGAIGLVGNTLGKAGLNINDMSVGKGDQGAALMVISVDRPASEQVKQELQAAEGISSVRLIELRP